MALAAYNTLPNPMLIDIPALVILAYVGVMFGYFGGEFNLAEPKHRNWRNYLRLTLKGATIALPLSLYTGHYYAIFAGCLFVVYYLLALSISDRHFPVIGDLIIGAAIASGLMYEP